MKIKKLILLTLLVLNFSIFCGCIDLGNNDDNNEQKKDPYIERSEPYFSKIETNDIELKAYANSIISECPDNDRECQLIKIYRYIVENFNYINDPEGIELIQGPHETMQIKGGDCEDLTILLNSLLENIGIKTYLVLTQDHAYSLAYDINTTLLWPYVEETLISQVEKEWGENITSTINQTLIIKAYESWYPSEGGDGLFFNNTNIEYMNINYKINSDTPLHFFLLPSIEEYHKYEDGETFLHYIEFEKEDILNYNGEISKMNRRAGIMLANEESSVATVNLYISTYLKPSFYKLFQNQTKIISYTIEGASCVVLDATAGDYGYPGYETEQIGEKTVVDIETEKIYLINQN